jgi:hypothetical protein
MKMKMKMKMKINYKKIVIAVLVFLEGSIVLPPRPSHPSIHRKARQHLSARRGMYKQYNKEGGTSPPEIVEPEVSKCPLTQEGMAFRPCQELLRSLLRSPRLAPLLWPLHQKMYPS